MAQRIAHYASFTIQFLHAYTKWAAQYSHT
jgi:hypothetical protein